MSNSNPKHVFERIVKPGLKVVRKVNNDNIKLNARITPPTPPT